MTDFELKQLYNRLSDLVESGKMNEQEAREEWGDALEEAGYDEEGFEEPNYYDPALWE